MLLSGMAANSPCIPIEVCKQMQEDRVKADIPNATRVFGTSAATAKPCLVIVFWQYFFQGIAFSLRESLFIIYFSLYADPQL